jgi:hypothetical protein
MNEIDKAVSIEIMIENMIKNQTSSDITLYCHNKYPDQTIEQIVEDIKRLIEEDDEKHGIFWKLYEMQLIVGKDKFEKMLKEYLQDEINKIGIEENVN